MRAAQSSGGTRTEAAPWLDRLPQAPIRTSAPLGWRHLEAHRFDGLRCWDLSLPPVDRHFIAIHLLRPCLVDTSWGGQVRRARSRPGHAMLMAAGQDSVWRCAEPVDELHVFLDPAIVREVAEEIGRGHFELIDGVALLDPAFADLGRQLLAEIESPGLGTTLFADITARSLALHLLRHHSTVREQAQRPRRMEMTAAQLRRATDYIEANLGGELSL